MKNFKKEESRAKKHNDLKKEGIANCNLYIYKNI